VITTEISNDLVRRVCPVCEAGLQSLVAGTQAGFTWRLCGTCGTRFVDRRPAPKEISRLYEEYYRPESLKVPEFVRLRLAEIVAGFSRYRRSGRLLDVGFGAGGLLAAADAAGWTCWGTEIAPQALTLGQERGWHVVSGDLLAADLPSEAFDVVCMVEVLEHVEDPIAYVREARRLLRPGGLFYATTPNGAGLNSRVLGAAWSVCSAPEHLQLFCLSSAGALLQRAGLIRRRIRTEGLNPIELRHWRMRGRKRGDIDRGTAGFALNQYLSSGPTRRALKRAANRFISLTRIGDTLKIYAEGPVGR
jgi:SAM-dependent methyltransferase